MEKIVDTGYKIDLHIHSVYSHWKDKSKVSKNTVENIPVLVDGLNQNGVQICAVTDHDSFGYDIYKTLKRYENDEQSSIIKVLPGVEFSVSFKAGEDNAVVHVIAIFDDSDEEKVSKISKAVADESGRPKYDCETAFSEEMFLSILRNINLDTVLIAHQKNTLSSKKHKKSDANSVGEERFREFVYTDYFEAYEFKNRKNEIFNKSFLSANNLSKDIRFISGSDCHDWNYYPKETKSDTTDFQYTFVKCLPTFRGLVMAITDHRRIKTNNSFFNPAATYLEKIEVSIDGENMVIPLSRGLNVIIGDNSIGKSMFVHILTDYTKKKTHTLKSNIVNSYKKYLKENKMIIKTVIGDDAIFGFDMQGEVREKFEEEKLNSDEFLKKYYPPSINTTTYLEVINRELDKVYMCIKTNFDIEEQKRELPRFKIIVNKEAPESLSFVGRLKRNNALVEGLDHVRSVAQTISEEIKTLSLSKWIEKNDYEKLIEIENQLRDFAKKYDSKKNAAIHENQKIGIIQAELAGFKNRYQSSVTDTQKEISAFQNNLSETIDRIVTLKKLESKNKRPEYRLSETNIEIQTNIVYDYEFNSRLEITEYDENYIDSIIKRALTKATSKNVFEMTEEELAEAIPYYNGLPAGALDEFKRRVSDILKEDFKQKYTIIEKGMDRTKELSAGFNSKIYFDLLSYEDSRGGIYIIDQPEDNISQKAIREYLLDRFKVMGGNRQVIIITHNPQFIVNLDVDNVIYLGKENGHFLIQSGALEYKCAEYNMLDIISTHIEGGLDTLKRRWKRYEKSSEI